SLNSSRNWAWAEAMDSSDRISRRTAASSAERPSSSSLHSTGVPSEMALAIDTNRSSSRTSASAVMCHLLCEPDEGAGHCHLRRGGAVLSEDLGHFGPGKPHLDACHDCLVIVGLQPQERLLVPIEQLPADRFLERRWIRRRL